MDYPDLSAGERRDRLFFLKDHSGAGAATRIDRTGVEAQYPASILPILPNGPEFELALPTQQPARDHAMAPYLCEQGVRRVVKELKSIRLGTNDIQHLVYKETKPLLLFKCHEDLSLTFDTANTALGHLVFGVQEHRRTGGGLIVQ